MNKNILRRYSDILDTQFKIPGTEIRFGLDFLIGLVPGLGDIISYILSGGLVLMMVKKGASSKAIMVMLLNILADSSIGSIPIVGDIFDLFFKSNKRNVDIFEKHFEEGKYHGSIWPLMLIVIASLFLMFLLMFYLVYYVIATLISII